MTMTFTPEAAKEPSLNLANVNAVDLVLWLGYSRAEVDREPGYLRLNARDVAARCRRRLWPERRNFDAGRDTSVDHARGCATVIDCGRRPGYLREKTEQLLAIAAAAGDGFVVAI